MAQYKTITEYLDTVSAQIRWKRVKPLVLSELEQHLSEQRDAFADEGHDDAEYMAIEEMGDPVALGLELDRIHRPKPQNGLLALTLLFAVICAGLRIGLTADWNYCYLNINPVTTVLSVLLGGVALVGGYFLDYTLLARHGKKVYLGALLLGVLLFFVSPRINHIPHYMRYVTACYPIVYAIWIQTCRNQGWRGLPRALFGILPLSAVCLLIPSKWDFLLLVIVGCGLFLLATSKDWFGVGRVKTMLTATAVFLPTTVMLVYQLVNSDLFMIRLDAFLHPERYPTGRGYSAMVTKTVLSGSQWLGQGQWDNPTYPWPYEMALPNCDSDLLLTTLIYRLGWVPFFLFIALFSALLCWAVVRCLHQRSLFGKMVVCSVLLTFSLRAIASIALSMGYAWTSVAFPFLVGNLQMVVDMGLLGLVLSVFRQDGVAQNTENLESSLRKRLHFERIGSEELLISYK